MKSFAQFDGFGQPLPSDAAASVWAQARAQQGALLTLAQAAARAGIHPKTARRLAAAGKLPGALRVGHLWRVDPTVQDATVGTPPLPSTATTGQHGPTARELRAWVERLLPLYMQQCDPEMGRAVLDACSALLRVAKQLETGAGYRLGASRSATATSGSESGAGATAGRGPR